MYSLPTELVPLLNHYVLLLQEQLPDKLHGIYLYGSVAQGFYEGKQSDIDFITVFTAELSDSELSQLLQVHQSLEGYYPLAATMDGVYIALAQVGKNNQQLDKYPYYATGSFCRAGHHDINPITWWSLGAPLYGPPLKVDVIWSEILMATQNNLRGYWQRKIEAISHTIATDDNIEWMVLTLCRIVATLETQMYTSKTKGGEYALAALPAHWHDIVREALRIRDRRPELSLYHSVAERSGDAVAFGRWILGYCEQLFPEGK